MYKIGYSPDGSLVGYMNFTLSYFNPADFEYGGPNSNKTHAVALEHPDTCRYHDFRYPPGHEKEYARTEVFWHILAARLAFVVVFQVCFESDLCHILASLWPENLFSICFLFVQNFVALSVMAIKMIIPNMSTELKERVRREAYLTNEIIIRTELLKAKGQLHLKREMSKRKETTS